jgi:hypothetical protein
MQMQWLQVGGPGPIGMVETQGNPPHFFDEKTGIIHWIKLDQWGMPLASKQTLYHDGFMQHPSAWPRMWPAAVFCGLLFLDPVFGGVPADPLVFP